jgi:hypothetical protein
MMGCLSEEPMRESNASPARLLEMLSDRFGAFEAIAYSTIKLARHVPEDELSNGCARGGGAAGVWI